MSRKRSNLANKANKSSTALQSSENRNDGWGNVINNLGTINSRSGSSTFLPTPKLSQLMLTNMYTGDAIARKIVDGIVDDALRGFINADDLLLEELKRVKAKQKIVEAATWGRLYGGAAIVAFADDGQDMQSPINVNRLRKVISLQIYDRYQITWTSLDINQDFYSEHYGQPEIYTITNPMGNMFKVHRSRMHFFGGEKTPTIGATNDGWDDSVLQSLYQALRNFGQTMNATAEITQDYVQTILSINGITEMLRQGRENEIIERIQITDMTRNSSNTIVLDAEKESYSKHSSSVSGLSDIIEKQQEVICAGSDRTMTRLFGVTSKGLGNSGSTDSDNLNNTIEAYRCDEIEPCIDWLIDILEAQSEWNDKPESFDWTFPSLKTSNEHEVAQNRLMAADMDMKYIDRGIPAEFLFKKRYSDGGFQTDIFISEEEMNELFGSDTFNDQEEDAIFKDVTEMQKQLSDEQNKQIVNSLTIKEDAINIEDLEYEQKKKDLELEFLRETCNLLKDINK